MEEDLPFVLCAWMEGSKARKSKSPKVNTREIIFLSSKDLFDEFKRSTKYKSCSKEVNCEVDTSTMTNAIHRHYHHGYWEPHSSSIEFCEINYEHSNHIVELHNTWSSIVGLSFFGILGLFLGNPTKELRFQVSYIILIIIGIGSACLHGTLYWVFQSSDELPMIYLILSWIYIRLEILTPPAKNGKRQQFKYPNLPLCLSIFSIIITVIYYKFLVKLYIAFNITFCSSVVTYISLIGRMFFCNDDKNLVEGRNEYDIITNNKTCQKLVRLATISCLFVAAPIWLIDVLFCQWTLDTVASRLYGMTPHILWHFTAGYGAYATIVYLESFRMQALYRPFEAKFLFGFIPIVVVAKDNDGNNNNKIDKQKRL